MPCSGIRRVPNGRGSERRKQTTGPQTRYCLLNSIEERSIKRHDRYATRPTERRPEKPAPQRRSHGARRRFRFNGRERNDVEEYSVSEGWIRVAAGKALDRHGRPITIKLTGVVEPYYRR